jgi:DNA-binding ferritin-like protein
MEYFISNPKKYNMKKNTTKKNKTTGGKKLLMIFLEMLNTVKLYHWKTQSFTQHKASDELYDKLNDTIDKFVEIFLGKNSRIDLTHIKCLTLKDYNSSKDFEKNIEYYKRFLVHLKLNNFEDTDLLNIRDELLGHLNQFSYLLTLK